MQFSIVSTLYLLGAAHGAFLAAMLLTQKSGPYRANLYLGCYTILFVITLLDYALVDAGLVYSLSYVHVLFWPREFLFGVLIYFYTRELTQPGTAPLRGWQWCHFIPAALHIIITWPLLLMPSEVHWRVLIDDAPSTMLEQIWWWLLDDFELILSVLHVAIYLLLALSLLKRHQGHVKRSYANLEKVSLRWLQNLLRGTLLIYLFWMADSLVSVDDQATDWAEISLGLAMVCLIYTMSFMGLKQVKVFSGQVSALASGDKETAPLDANINTPPFKLVHDIERQEKQKYQNSSLSPEMCAQLMLELEQLMQEQKLYRDNTLSLPDLAESMGVSVNYLSQVINQQAGLNFFDFVNRYRVSDVQNQLQKNPQINVLEAAFAAGFNSKSAFYAAFRKHTGQTPTQYKKNIKSVA